MANIQMTIIGLALIHKSADSKAWNIFLPFDTDGYHCGRFTYKKHSEKVDSIEIADSLRRGKNVNITSPTTANLGDIPSEIFDFSASYAHGSGTKLGIKPVNPNSAKIILNTGVLSINTANVVPTTFALVEDAGKDASGNKLVNIKRHIKNPIKSLSINFSFTGSDLTTGLKDDDNKPISFDPGVNKKHIIEINNDCLNSNTNDFQRLYEGVKVAPKFGLEWIGHVDLINKYKVGTNKVKRTVLEKDQNMKRNELIVKGMTSENITARETNDITYPCIIGQGSNI